MTYHAHVYAVALPTGRVAMMVAALTLYRSYSHNRFSLLEVTHECQPSTIRIYNP